MADATDDTASYAKIREQLTTTNTMTMASILKRAEKRGEIAPTRHSNRLLTLPIDLVRHEILVNGRPPTHEAILQIVDEIFLPLLINK